MLRLDKVIKPWKESAALNDHINLYGFWSETAFLTKSGDLGMVLSISGVDYESLDHSEQEYAVKRLEAALKAFGPGFHVYQYLFKTNRPDIPFAKYDEPIVEAAIDQRRKFFEAKRDNLYQVEIFYCVLLEGARSKTGVGTALARLIRDPEGATTELKSQFTNDSMKTLLRTHIEHDLRRLDQHVQAFARQLADFMQIEILNRQGQFRFFRRLLNYDDWRVAGRPQSGQFLDYQVVNSDIESERDHLRVGDHTVRVLTMKEAITETRPLVLDALLKIPANFYVVTEWMPLPADKARKEVNKRRRHFNMSKTGFVSQMGNDATKTNPRDVLVDESKQADIENLGDCLRALGDGQSLGDFSLTIVLYGRSRTELDQLVAEFTGVFTNADGNLFAETYNQLNAYLYTLGALFLSLVATGFFIYVRFQFGFSPLECYYLPYYLRSEMAGLTRHASTYQLLYVSDDKSRARPALEADVEAGSTPQSTGKALPLALSSQDRRRGFRLLFREEPRSYQNKAIHGWMAHWVYQDIPLSNLFTMQLVFGLAAFAMQLPFSIRRDIQRIKRLRYGRRLKGPVLVNAKDFTKAVSGDGIGIATNDSKLPLRIPRDAENKHFLIVGDTGSGKSSIIRQMLYQVDARGDSAIVYDPACEFVKQFYNERRGDIVLNPLDARMPYWNPSKELRRKAEAKALAVSLYQPEGVTNRFFVEAPQKIFAHLLTYLPTPDELVAWMSDPAEIDRRVKGTEYWMLIDPKAPQQRTGVLGSLNMSADSFRLLPKQDETTSVWTATNWAETRRGWIFITSRPTMREALRWCGGRPSWLAARAWPRRLHRNAPASDCALESPG